MRYLYLLLVCFGFSMSYGQSEVELAIGDTLYFAECNSEAYEYIDLYVKTRFELDSISYDSLNGWEFFNRFFNTGDFDVSRLPCQYQGQYGIIKHMMAVETESGDYLNVIVVMIRDGSSVGYVTEYAFEDEVIYASKENPDH